MNNLDLTPHDQAMLAGEEGPAVEMAMRILVRMMPVFGATRLMDVSAAHIDSSVYMGPATMEYAERLAELGARVRVPSTLNVAGVDEHGWSDWSVPSGVADGAIRQMRAYEKMGCIQTWTCAPYQTEHRPVFGQQIAAGESNAICFFNSVIGARTARYPDLLDICAAITGRVPAAGLHLDSGRHGTLRVDLVGVPQRVQESDAFWPVLGILLGKLSGDGVPVVTGIEVKPSDDDQKAVCAGAASSGAVALYHMVGITPEAPTEEAAFGGRPAPKVVTAGMEEMRAVWRAMSASRPDDGGNGVIPAGSSGAIEPLRTAPGSQGDGAAGSVPAEGPGALDMVLLGSPHFSFDEFRRLAKLVEGRKRNPDVQFLITCSRSVRMLVEHGGLLEPIASFGARITVDTCPLTSPMLSKRIGTIMTNSAKYSYYSPGLLGTGVVYGSLEDCVESAVSGRVVRDESLWVAA
ncbi:MAG: aconitase X catalytic domain-containing protein [Rhodothermales bacterium]